MNLVAAISVDQTNIQVGTKLARNPSDPPLHQAPLIHDRKTFKCYIAFRSIPKSCNIAPLIMFYYQLIFYCMVLNHLSEYHTFCVHNVMWSVMDCPWNLTNWRIAYIR